MIRREGNRVHISGRLTMDTATSLFNSGLQPNGQTDLVVDMAQVEAVDSAAVSLMLAWLREARRSGIGLSFSNVPDNLLSLAHLYDVAESLPLSGDGAARP
ncbi:MAG: STAS domain-containing protein [Nitrosomonadales bacterium]|nr:STAS domain-containing protein [Nitrosomonadales bacterium]